MTESAAVLANAGDALRVLRGSVWSWVALAVVLIVLAGIVFWIRSLFLEDTGPTAEASEMLLLARNLRRQGDLTDDEYRSIKGRLDVEVEAETTADPADDSISDNSSPESTPTPP